MEEFRKFEDSYFNFSNDWISVEDKTRELIESSVTIIFKSNEQIDKELEELKKIEEVNKEITETLNMNEEIIIKEKESCSRFETRLFNFQNYLTSLEEDYQILNQTLKEKLEKIKSIEANSLQNSINENNYHTLKSHLQITLKEISAKKFESKNLKSQWVNLTTELEEKRNELGFLLYNYEESMKELDDLYYEYSKQENLMKVQKDKVQNLEERIQSLKVENEQISSKKESESEDVDIKSLKKPLKQLEMINRLSAEFSKAKRKKGILNPNDLKAKWIRTRTLSTDSGFQGSRIKYSGRKPNNSILELSSNSESESEPIVTRASSREFTFAKYSVAFIGRKKKLGNSSRFFEVKKLSVQLEEDNEDEEIGQSQYENNEREGNSIQRETRELGLIKRLRNAITYKNFIRFLKIQTFIASSALGGILLFFFLQKNTSRK